MSSNSSLGRRGVWIRRSRNWPIAFLLLLNAALLLIPKLALIQFVNRHLWGDVSAGTLAGAIAQDLLVALVVSIATISLLRKPSRLRVLAVALACGGILLLLMIDMRVRELWLIPLNVATIEYAVGNASDLASGMDLFFNYTAVYSVTFRRFLFVIGMAYAAIWCLVGWALTTGRQAILFGWSWSGSLMVIALAGILFALALSAPRYRYRIGENILVGYPLAALHAIVAGEGGERNRQSVEFEQASSPLSSQLENERRILREVKPFTNVVVVVYESMRWKDINILGEGPTVSPVLARMAANGLVSKAYVSVPHSSKAYFAILTGRHPYPGIEMREIFAATNPSLWHHLRSARGLKTRAFSSLYLGFEGMGKLLKSFGIEPREARELANESGVAIPALSSFGTDDSYLYRLGSKAVAEAGTPFAAVFFPLAAHYPYGCKGSVAGRHDRLDHRACVAESDANLGLLLDEFRRLGLMDDTLFVVVGDHGESFGEHGTFVHNSSMYDEEVTVPLVFWSEDGRLRQRPLQYSRQIDIAPTIADLMGAMASDLPVQGTSLLRQANPAPPVFMATFFDGLGAALFEAPYKYIYDLATERVTVFDLAKDPYESSAIDVREERKLAVRARIGAFLAYQERTFPHR